MGFLYIKVIESKKVAIRSSFFVNYPFIRLRIGKEKKDTNFKPGVEWWDKIYCFREVSPDVHTTLLAQARDKSIHVFGSDWLGETSVDLNHLMDGKVHQLWFKLGKGHRNHSRSPRGYLHLAFHYFHSHPNGKRPFSEAPVEKVVTFEEWLAINPSTESSFFSTSTADINPTDNEKLRQSAPASIQSPENSPPTAKKGSLASKQKSKSTNQLTETRGRSKTIPVDKNAKDEDSDDSNSSYEESVPTANLIDFSFDDNPKKKNVGRANDVGTELFNKESPVRYSPKSLNTSRSATSVNSAQPIVAPADIYQKLNSNPTFEEWYHPTAESANPSYNPKNPFLSLHDTHAPTFAVQK